jgi:hypothetical protein
MTQATAPNETQRENDHDDEASHRIRAPAPAAWTAEAAL